MPKTMRNVLKANEVQSAEPLQLSLDPAAAPRPGAVAAAPTRIRIAENHPEYALLEVTCSCGKTTFVRCDYGPAPA